MMNWLRTVEFLGLSLWLGSDVFLSFVMAPGAFRILASRDQAGAMVGYGLWWMHMIGVVCGVAPDFRVTRRWSDSDRIGSFVFDGERFRRRKLKNKHFCRPPPLTPCF